MVRASLRNHLHGAYWLARYESDIDNLIDTILAEDIDGNTLPPLERILLVLGKRQYLDEIADNDDWNSFSRSKAEHYRDVCNEAIHRRVIEYTSDNVIVDNESYAVDDLVYERGDHTLEELMHKLADSLLDNDDSVTRTRLRCIELVYLGANG